MQQLGLDAFESEVHSCGNVLYFSNIRRNKMCSTMCKWIFALIYKYTRVMHREKLL